MWVIRGGVSIREVTQSRGALRGLGCTPILVGASLLAMVVNDIAHCLDERGGRTLFASRLAPTVDRVQA